MLLRRLITAITLSILLAPCLRSQDKVEVFPLSEVKAGLQGVGRSVFQGDTVEEFQVEILGVMKNAIAPKRDVILARLSSNSLARTGVVVGLWQFQLAELILIPGLVVLASAVGYLPAMSAYRTDVAKSLITTP